MNKYLVRIIAGTAFFLILFVILIFVYDSSLHKEENINSPSVLGSYWNTGYYKIDPETILTSLENGDNNVFVPFLEKPDEIDEVTDVSIRWTQTDFLKIASALGKFVWDDSMDLKDWNVYYISFEGSCNDPIGFNFASITYFRAGTKRYATRLIEIEPYFGWVKFGDGNSYSKPFYIDGWCDMARQTHADDACTSK